MFANFLNRYHFLTSHAKCTSMNAATSFVITALTPATLVGKLRELLFTCGSVVNSQL